MKSKNTLINYENSIKRFNQAKMELDKYFNALTASAQKMFLAAAKYSKVVSLNELESLKENAKKVQEPTQSVLTLEQIQKLKQVVKGMDIKTQAVVLTMLNTGCRKFEVNQIWEKFNGNNTLKITGKGGKLAKVFIDNELLNILNNWKQHPEFKYYSLKQLENITKNALWSAGLDGACHTLRRSFATNLRNHNTPLELIKTILRHDDINTTIKYIKYNDNDVFNALKNQNINVDSYVNETNYKQVVLDLIIKNNNQAEQIKKLEEIINNNNQDKIKIVPPEGELLEYKSFKDGNGEGHKIFVSGHK